MSFWRFWSRKTVLPEAVSAKLPPQEALPFTDADREFVRSALDRFEANGLQIWSELNRDLIVARALVDIDLWKPNDGWPRDELQSLFMVLANGTDSLPGRYPEVEDECPALATMDDEAAEEMLQRHSETIFVNASSICIVSEGGSLNNTTYALAALGNLEVSEVEQHVLKNGLTRVSFQVEGLGERHFDVESAKRPDVTPVFVEMNRIAEIKKLGRYIPAWERNSDSETFIFADEATLSKITSLLKLAV